MSLVFQNIDPSPPSDCVPPAFGAGGGHTRWLGGEGVGGDILEDARHSSVLYSTLWSPPSPSSAGECVPLFGSGERGGAKFDTSHYYIFFSYAIS
jgi:hypothetical protein